MTNNRLYEDACKIPKISEAELAELLADGSPAAINKIWVANLRLVYKVVRQYQNEITETSSITKDDLVSAGCIGLRNALKTYKLEKGKFSTWANFYIRNEITEELARHLKTIKIPMYKKQLTRYELKNFDLKFDPTARQITAHDIIDNFSKYLSKKEIKYFVEYYCNDKEQLEIAHEYGLTKAAISAHLISARKKLQRKKNFIFSELS